MVYSMREIIITVSVLVICILSIRRIFRGRIGRRFQYALWILVALRLMIPVSIPADSPFGEFTSQYRLMELNTDEVVEKLAEPIQVTINSRNGMYRLLVQDTDKTAGSAPQEFEGSASFMAGHLGYSWLDVMGILWILGMIIITAWILVTNRIFGRRLKRERRLMELSKEAESALRRRLPEKIAGMYDGIKIYIVDGLASPCLYGLPGREAVYLTPDITEDTDRLCHVLTHEFCHKKHGDSFWGVLRGLLVAIYWFHPFVWAAAILSKRDCELACDETALIFLGEEERISYGETLLSIISRKARVSDFICTATTMTGSGKSVKERIGFIVKEPKVLRMAVALTAVLMAAAFVFAFTKSYESVRIMAFGNDTDIITGADMQIPLPDSIRFVCGQVIEEGSDDVIIYHVESRQEVGRFSRMSLKDVLQLVDEGKNVVPLSDYGDNYLLKAYLGFSGGSVSKTMHYYTPAEQNEDNGLSGVPGTDSNMETESVYMSKESGGTQIPAPEKTDSYTFPLPYKEGQSLSAEEYAQKDQISYLPDEQVKTTTIYPEDNVEELSHVGCYVYIKADYDKVKNRYFEEMERINRELESVAEEVIVLSLNGEIRK